MRFSTSFGAPLGFCAGLSLLLAGCPTPPGEGEGEGEGEEDCAVGGTGVCPAATAGVTICDLQDPNSANHVESGAATLESVAAVSAPFILDRDNVTGEAILYGFYASDVPVAKRSGILITYFADLDPAPPAFVAGDLLRIEGTVGEFGQQAPCKETRLTAQTIESLGSAAVLAPLDLGTDPSALDDQRTAEDYEGVLVTLGPTAVATIEQFFFTITGGIAVDDVIYGYPAVAGETFTSITGVVGYNVFSGGGFRIYPRAPGDVVSDERPSVNVADLVQETNGVERCAGDGEYNQCVVSVGNAVVLAAPLYNGFDDERGKRFLIPVGDPEGVDSEEGRLLPNSAIWLSISPDDPTDPVASSYSFDQDEDYNFLPGAAPEPGDVVTFTGDNAEYFGERRVRFVSILNKLGTVADDFPEMEILPALFDGSLASSDERHPSRLKGGRPEGDDPDAAVLTWQASLVELTNVETTDACFPTEVSSVDRDFGYFLVTGDVEVGDTFQTYFSGRIPYDEEGEPLFESTCDNVDQRCGPGDSRELGQAFSSLVGIVNYSYEVHRVNPRTLDDIDVDTPFNTETCE